MWAREEGLETLQPILQEFDRHGLQVYQGLVGLTIRDHSERHPRNIMALSINLAYDNNTHPTMATDCQKGGR